MEGLARRPLTHAEVIRFRDLLIKKREEILERDPQSETVKEIEEALQRISAGEYGRCKDCGEWIRIKRLETIPWAVRCRSCQERWEMLEAVE